MRALRKPSRRGRPRKQQAATDRGTPETQSFRRKLAAGGDPTLTEYPLGLLRLRALIDGDQHEAGCRYAYLYRQAIGRAQVSYDHLYRELLAVPGGGSERPEASQAQVEALFRRAKRRLMAAGRQICEATEDVAVFGRMPLILGDPRPNGPGVRQLGAIRAGLDALHKDRHFSVDK
jgi:hypothetical protein